MRALLSDLENNSFNPLDLIEDVVVSNDWPHNRADNDTLYVEVGGEWCDYLLTLAWSNDNKLLYFCEFCVSCRPIFKFYKII